MTVSQQINSIDQSSNLYDVDYTVTSVPSHFFIAVTSNQIPSGSSTREVTIELLPLEQGPGGTCNTNSGAYTRGSNETSIKVTVKKEGNDVAENTTNY